MSFDRTYVSIKVRWWATSGGLEMKTVFVWSFCGLLLGILCPKTWALPTPVTLSNNTARQICWRTKGIFEQDCYHADPLTPYPLSEAMFNRSVPYDTPDLLFHRAFQRARERGLLRVVALGGSVTAGHGCITPAGLKDTDCAWPRRLQQWFEERVHDFRVEVGVIEDSLCVLFATSCRCLERASTGLEHHAGANYIVLTLDCGQLPFRL